MEKYTKLKDSTFAIIAEKKDSISHKWFIENCQNVPTWEIGLFYLYNPKYKNFEVYVMEKNVPKGKFIYNESRFEYLLKAEQLNETLQRKITDSEEVMKNAETLSQKQIESVISWMETWEQLRDTSIPIRFREDFRNKLKAEEFNEGVDLQRQSAERMINLKPKAEQENEKPEWAKPKATLRPLNEFTPLTAKVLNEPKQITISYNLAIEYIAERLNVDKGIIKIEM